MTERFRPSPDFEDIPRRSPTHEIHVNGEPIELTWYNTQYVIYSDTAYGDMAHVRISADYEPTAVFFGSIPLIQSLMQNDYPGAIYPEPTPEVLELYYKYQAYRLDQDLASLQDE